MDDSVWTVISILGTAFALVAFTGAVIGLVEAAERRGRRARDVGRRGH